MADISVSVAERCNLHCKAKRWCVIGKQQQKRRCAVFDSEIPPLEMLIRLSAAVGLALLLGLEREVIKEG
jgi:hypothetical protein